MKPVPFYVCTSCETIFESDIGDKCTVLIYAGSYCNGPIKKMFLASDIENLIKERQKDLACHRHSKNADVEACNQRLTELDLILAAP